MCTGLSLTSVLTKLYFVQLQYSNILDIFVLVLCASILILYQVKYLLQKDINRSIVETMDYVDECFKSLNISVPHVQNLIIVIVYTALNVTGFIAFVSTDLLSMVIKRLFDTDDEMTLAYEMNLLSTIIVSTLFSLMYFLLYMQSMFSVCAIWQRMKLLYVALAKFDSLSDARVAWGDSSVIVMTNEERITEIYYYYKKLQSIYCGLCEVYHRTREFYASFICLNIYLSIVSYTLEIIVDAMFHGRVICRFGSLYGLAKIVFPVFAISCLRKEIERINTLLIGLAHKKQLRCVQSDVSKWKYRIAHSGLVFDCGYFEMDISVLCFITNFTSLFVFSILADFN